MSDPFDRFGFEQTDGVADATPAEVRVVVPVADGHHPQRAMLCGEILQLIVIEVAPQPHGGQHDDLPVTETFAPAVILRVVIDVRDDQHADRIFRSSAWE